MLKTIPYYFYQVDAIESWLDEQARNGLFLQQSSIGSMMSFQKDTPRSARYRIDVKRNLGYNGEQERISSYKEMGWEYVCDMTPYLDIYRCDDPAVPELNTDEETLHEVLDKRLSSELRWGRIGIVLLVFLLGQELYSITKNCDGLYDALLNGYALLLLGWVLLGGFWLLRLLFAMRAAEATQKSLLLTRDRHCTAAVRRNLHIQRAANIMLALAVLICVAAWRGTHSKDIPVKDVPIPSIEEVFSGISPAPSEYPGSPHNENSWASESSSPLYRIRYVRQYGPYVTDPDTGQTHNSWYYDADVYDIAWTWLAEGYAGERAQKGGAEPIVVPGWKNAWYTADEAQWGGQLLILQNGGTIWRIAYDGEHRLTDALTAFAK